MYSRQFRNEKNLGLVFWGWLVGLFGPIYTVRLVACDKVVPCKSALTEGKTMDERSTRYSKIKLDRPRSLIFINTGGSWPSSFFVCF